MYPATIFEYVDESKIEKPNISTSSVKPVFMCAFTSDKGPEDYRVVSGDDFFKLYGNNISFKKHGQPLLQTAMLINSGAAVFCKRVVDPASTLANATVYADVSQKQKTNADGEPLYLDEDGSETIEAVGNTPINLVSIKYGAKTIESQASPNAVSIAASAVNEISTFNEEGHTYYPLYTITDIGRGVSNKKWTIQPDYTSAKSVDYMVYQINVYEGNQKLEGIQFAFDPEMVDGSKNISAENMVKNNSSQITLIQHPDTMNLFVAKLAELSGVSADDLILNDILFGCTKKGVSYDGIIVEEASDDNQESINLTSIGGNSLSNGSNGDFGNAPMEAEGYESEMAKVFTGEYDNCIYDLNNYKIDAIIDANYGATVKSAIADLVTFREDCFYFRDMGIDKTSIDAVKDTMTNDPGHAIKNKFIGDYITSYDVIDPYTKKQITVTIGYSIAKLIVAHFEGGRNRPLAGILNNFILTDAIKGTVNIIPVITPSENQKEILDDLRVNYASYYDDRLVVESLYTQNNKYSEFSYINNILAIQEVIRAVRTYCPEVRYSFISGDDLEKYKNDVQKVLDRYANNFMSMTLEYISDTVYISNRIFYAAIKVQFKKFVQTEYFKVIALPATTV